MQKLLYLSVTSSLSDLLAMSQTSPITLSTQFPRSPKYAAHEHRFLRVWKHSWSVDGADGAVGAGAEGDLVGFDVVDGAEGASTGDADGVGDGAGDTVGVATTGALLGTLLGALLGTLLGALLGTLLGALLGTLLGVDVGVPVVCALTRAAEPTIRKRSAR
jgi:hypothetical protein